MRTVSHLKGSRLFGEKTVPLPGSRPAIDHSRISRTLEFATKSKNPQLRITDLVKKSGMSRRGFFKAFGKHTGTKPGLLLRSFRIEKAKKLLVEKDVSLAEIADQCGYRSVNTLWVAFRNATGMAPKKFQRQAWLGAYLSNPRKSSAQG